MSVSPTTGTAETERTDDDTSTSLRLSITSAVRSCLIVGLLLAGYLLAPWDRKPNLSAIAQLTVWLVVIVAALLWQIRAVLRSKRPWLRAVEGTVIGVALLLLPFAAAYARMSALDPATFTQPLSRVDAFYFTVTVFSTVGFGDITPVSQSARLLVTTQMLADLILIGTIIKVLIGAAQRRREALGPRSRRVGPRF